MNYLKIINSFSFDLIERKWTTLKPAGVGPSARSGVQMGACEKGIIVIGGYSKLKAKKDSDRGNIHADGFCLQFEPSKIGNG